ncbi:MAG: hypothetical protein ACSLFD_02980 [Solirubrobacterales bacterium]
MKNGTDYPTNVLGGDDEEPTGRLESEAGDTEVRPPSPDDSRQRGINMLVGSILAAVVLVAVYIAAGGLDYEPSTAADPCDQRAWTDPGNLEEAAQQFAFSAVDGAACELGVSREELTRALADDTSRQAFQEDQGLSDPEVEDALRAGLNRAIDDAENAGVIDGLAVTGLRAAVRFLPVDQMIPLIEDASGFLSGESVGGIEDVLDGVIDSLDGGDGDSGDPGTTGGSGTTGEGPLPNDLGNQIEEGLRDQLPPEIERNLPDDLQQQAEQQLENLINP